MGIPLRSRPDAQNQTPMIGADVRARRLSASINVTAPADRGARARVSWLVNQLKDAPRDLVIEAFAKNARSRTSATLGKTRDDRLVVLDDSRTEPYRFRVAVGAEMGLSRKARPRSPWFIDSVLRLINGFYGNVVQDISPWQRPTPKLESTGATEVYEAPSA